MYALIGRRTIIADLMQGIIVGGIMAFIVVQQPKSLNRSSLWQ